MFELLGVFILYIWTGTDFGVEVYIHTDDVVDR